MRRWRFDRLIVGTQHYFAVRDRLASFDPTGNPLFPLADPADLDRPPYR